MTRDRGNILFLILLAVVLFAALAYAVTSSMRGGGKSGSAEKSRALASSLIQYGALTQNTIQRTMMLNSIPEYGFDFGSDGGISGSTTNATCTQTACRVFTRSTREGIMSVQKFGEEYVDPRFRARFPGGTGSSMSFGMAQVLDLGTTKPELIMVVTGLSTEICNAINDILWNTPAGYGNETYGSGWNQTTGLYTGTITELPTTYGVFGDDSTFFKGKQAGCIGREHLGAGDAYGGDFYQVLIER